MNAEGKKESKVKKTKERKKEDIPLTRTHMYAYTRIRDLAGIDLL